MPASPRLPNNFVRGSRRLRDKALAACAAVRIHDGDDGGLMLRCGGSSLETSVKSILIALAFALPFSITTLPASAQAPPTYAREQAAAAAGDDAQIRGRVSGFDGGYNLRVTDENGYADNIELHEGTIINPTGLTLEPGMVVSILGYNAGSYFAANEIDTPYTYEGDVPYYGGRRWDSYGPSVELGFFFGNTGWWHGDAFGGENRFDGGARVFTNVRVRNTYHGGAFQGRAYVAPPERGGYRASSGAGHAQAAPHSGGGGRR